MSSKILGVLPHQLISYDEIEQLPMRLHSLLGLVSRVNELYWEGLETKVQEPAWTIGVWGRPTGATPRQQWESGQGPMIFGPYSIVDAGAWIVLGRRTLFVNTTVKWGVAMARPNLLRSVHDLVRAIAVNLGCSAFLLCRDHGCLTWDWVLDGKSLDEVENEMHREGARRVTDLDVLPGSQSELRYYFESLDDR